MRNKKINIGTSGWSYKHWKGEFYPEEMKPTDYLLFYTEHFDTTEINSSFYHLPRRSTVEQWVEKTPKKFRFCPKISRYITHIKRLHDPEETVARFFEVFEPMKEKMGPVLVQLPPSLKFKKNIYVRFHGPKELYASSYSDKMLKGFADKFKHWVSEGHSIWAFFNNDVHMHALHNGKTLQQMLQEMEMKKA